MRQATSLAAFFLVYGPSYVFYGQRWASRLQGIGWERASLMLAAFHYFSLM